MTDDMLEVARRNALVVSENIGYSNVEFRKGRIQDLKVDMEALDLMIESHPVQNSNSLMELEAKIEQLREDQPMIDDDSIDVVVSNCVLNLVDADKKKTLFRELHRVLKNGGRAVISDIVSDESVTSEMMRDPELWSGCLSGAMTESGFLQAFEDAGFYGIRYRKFDLNPWRVVDGVVFRSVTVEAFKASDREEKDLNQAIIYNGPFSRVVDDEGIVLERGVRIAVSDRKYEQYQRPPYKESMTMIPPSTAVESGKAPVFDKDAVSKRRPPKESKGSDSAVQNRSAESCCSKESSCC
jgi:SAM-dependent methyltransferase